MSSHPFAPRASTIWPTNLKVPHDEATSQNYDPIHIAYRIKVVALVAWGQALVAKIPITIGNIPYRESLVNTDVRSFRDAPHLWPHPSVVTLMPEDGNTHYMLDSQVSAPSQEPHSLSQHSTTTSTDSCMCAQDSLHYCIDGDPSDLHSVAHGNSDV